jgi:hypothetical protein
MNPFSHDEILAILQNEMNELSQFNTQNAMRLAEKQRENKFIQGVVADYKKHNQSIMNLKQQQKQQIEYLLHYIENALSQAGVTESMITQAKYERRELLKQLDEIKASIDDLISVDNSMISK